MLDSCVGGNTEFPTTGQSSGTPNRRTSLSISSPTSEFALCQSEVGLQTNEIDKTAYGRKVDSPSFRVGEIRDKKLADKRAV